LPIADFKKIGNWQSEIGNVFTSST